MAPWSLDLNPEPVVAGEGSRSGQHTGTIGFVLANSPYGDYRGKNRINVRACRPTAASFEEPGAIGQQRRSSYVRSDLGDPPAHANAQPGPPGRRNLRAG